MTNLWAMKTRGGVWIYLNPDQIIEIIPRKYEFSDDGFDVMVVGREKPLECQGNFYQLLNRVAKVAYVNTIVFDNVELDKAEAKKLEEYGIYMKAREAMESTGEEKARDADGCCGKNLSVDC